MKHEAIEMRKNNIWIKKIILFIKIEKPAKMCKKTRKESVKNFSHKSQ